MDGQIKDGLTPDQRAALHTDISLFGDVRDGERMLTCESWRRAGATPADRERYYLRRNQELNGEFLV